MSQWHGLLYKLKAGSEPSVEELFHKSGRPEHVVRGADGAVKGRLLRTIVLMGEAMCVRVIEVEGELADVAAHMSRQPEVRAFEREIEKHLAVPRDMTTPGGARAFFEQSGLRCVLDRRSDE
jgi:hypothetical protein